MSVPAKTSGSSGCARNVNDVTTPKLPPPPRRPQNRSACSVGARADVLAGREDDVGRDEVVDRQAVRPGQPADAAAERQARDPRPRDDADRHRQAERLRRAIDVAERRPGLDAHEPRVGIDLDRRRAARGPGRSRRRPCRCPRRCGRRRGSRAAGRVSRANAIVGATSSALARLDDQARAACRSSRSRRAAPRRSRRSSRGHDASPDRGAQPSRSVRRSCVMARSSSPRWSSLRR